MENNASKRMVLTETVFPQVPKEILDHIANYRELMMVYNSAIREVTTKTSLDDVAGIRVICSFIDDVYRIADMLVKQDDITLIESKDYIKHPKPNGYRSYHMIIEIPVFFSKKKEYVRVEIQIRTVAMDFWASLEHQLRYKKNLEYDKSIDEELKSCADTIAETDSRMMDLRNRIDKT